MADTPSPDDAIFGDKPEEKSGVPLTPSTPPPPPPQVPPQPQVQPLPQGRGAGSTIINDAFNWTVQAFRQDAGQFIGLAAIVFALKLAQGLAGTALGPSTSGTVTATLTILAGLLGTLFAVLSILASVGVYRAALRRTQGVAPTLDAMVSGENLGRFLIVGLCFGLAIGIGLFLCFAPGLLALFFFVFSPYFALDKGFGVRRAFAASSRLVLDNLGTVFIAGLVAILAFLLSGLFYGVLTLVMLPFSALFTAYVYRRVLGEPVAP